MNSIDTFRRRLLGAFGLGAGALAAGAATAAAAPGKTGAGGPAASGAPLVLEYDVAVLGHTNYDNEDGAWNRHPDYSGRSKDPQKFREGFRRSDLRGSSFYHEGLIYPGGTIPEPENPMAINWRFEKPPIGTFFDRGWVVINNKSEPPFVPRPNPHLLSHTDYYLGGVVGEGNLTPTDMIATVGLQHNNGNVGSFLRAVVGGTGRYATVRGQLIQTHLGNNDSQLHGLFLPDGVKVPSPNFRLRFEIWT
jgi:hypothetical protein